MSADVLHHLDCGPREGLPVLLLHAFPLSGEMWRAQIDALSIRYRVVACDFRGFGETPAGDGQRMLEHFVDDVVALLDHLAIDRAIVGGISMGGYVALRLAEREPARVRALVLADTRSEADTNEAKVKRAGAMTAVARDGVASFARGFVKTAFHPATFTDKPQVIETALRLIEAASPAGVRGGLLALASRTDTTASLASITVPTLVLVGADDALTPPEAARALHAKIPGAELAVLAGAAHMSNMEAPEEFNLQLASFLQRLEST